MNIADLMKVLAPLLITIVASNAVLVKVIHWLMAKKLDGNGSVHPHDGCDKEPRIRSLEEKVPGMAEDIAAMKVQGDNQGNQIKDIKTNTDSIVHAMLRKGLIDP